MGYPFLIKAEGLFIKRVYCKGADPMMDQAGVFRASVCAVAASVLTTVCAQDAQPVVEQPAATPAVAAAPADAVAPAVAEPAKPAKLFDPLVRVMNIRGVCEVKNPDVGSFQPVLNNKAYPLGSSFRTGLGGSAVISFSAQESVQLLEGSEMVAACPEKDPDGRLVRIISGKVKTTLRDNLPEGVFGIETPNTICRNVAGRGEITLSSDANTETLQIAIITGSTRVEGPQYQVPALRAANTLNACREPDGHGVPPFRVCARTPHSLHWRTDRVGGGRREGKRQGRDARSPFNGRQKRRGSCRREDHQTCGRKSGKGRREINTRG
jgi:hypothetical protein